MNCVAAAAIGPALARRGADKMAKLEDQFAYVDRPYRQVLRGKPSWPVRKYCNLHTTV